jgi:hypothetical protein
LLTGSPGCGKTTVAPLVADLRPRSACLDLDWFFAKLRQGAIEPWKHEAHEQNRVVLAAAAAALATYVAGGYDTVGEGILYPFMLDLFAAASEPLAIQVHYAVLAAPLAVVQQRVLERAEEPEHFVTFDATVVDDLWSQFEQHGVSERHRVDAGERGPAEVAEELDRRWRAGDFALAD